MYRVAIWVEILVGFFVFRGDSSNLYNEVLDLNIIGFKEGFFCL